MKRPERSMGYWMEYEEGGGPRPPVLHSTFTTYHTLHLVRSRQRQHRHLSKLGRMSRSIGRTGMACFFHLGRIRWKGKGVNGESWRRSHLLGSSHHPRGSIQGLRVSYFSRIAWIQLMSVSSSSEPRRTRKRPKLSSLTRLSWADRSSSARSAQPCST